MRKRVLLAVIGLGALGLLLAPSATAQVPTRDSVALTGGPADASGFVLTDLQATSGPRGENPSGQITLDVTFIQLILSGPVTCLEVRGKTATLNFQAQTGGFDIVTIQVVDDQPDTFDILPVNRLPTDCSPLPPDFIPLPVSGGDIVVIDAPPFPSSRDQCKHGGWRSFGVFKNQGDCVSFVATGGQNPPAGSKNP